MPAREVAAVVTSSRKILRRVFGDFRFEDGRVLRGAASVIAIVAITAIALGGCSSSTVPRAGSPAVSAAGAVDGGTGYFAEQPESPPDYIFPLISSQSFTVENTADFRSLLYEPLYWF